MVLNPWWNKQQAFFFLTHFCGILCLRLCVCVQIILKVLGDYQKVIVHWPSILSLVFLLGRFIYILVKDVRTHLHLEAEVSMEKEWTPADFPYARLHMPAHHTSRCSNQDSFAERWCRSAAGARGVDGAAPAATCSGPAEEKACVQVGCSSLLLSNRRIFPFCVEVKCENPCGHMEAIWSTQPDRGSAQAEDHSCCVDRWFVHLLPPCAAGSLSAGSRGGFMNGIRTSNSQTGSLELS